MWLAGRRQALQAVCVCVVLNDGTQLSLRCDQVQNRATLLFCISPSCDSAAPPRPPNSPYRHPTPTLQEGLVKLADFGVAAKLGELEAQAQQGLESAPVGTPYWMAPEVGGCA